MIGGLSFLQPWVLTALLALPLVWLLLRTAPPAPKRLSFPAMRLLAGLETAQSAAERTPWWVLLFRLCLAALLIVALAHPVWNAEKTPLDAPFLIVVDQGWASGRHWPEAESRIAAILSEAERQEQPVSFVTTADDEKGIGPRYSGLMTATEARLFAGGIAPQPWSADYARAAAALSTLPSIAGFNIFWLSDGLDAPEKRAFAALLEKRGPVRLFVPKEGEEAKILLPPGNFGGGKISVEILTAPSAAAQFATLLALDGDGYAVERRTIAFEAGAGKASATLSLPVEQRNRIARLALEGENTAAAVTLTDDGFRRRSVGLIDRPGQTTSPLLEDGYYAERAIAPFADLARGSVDDLLQRPPAMILAPDGVFSEQEAESLRRWIDKGGVLVRFGGPKLAAGNDGLLPVRLLRGGRALGGSMSWTSPMTLAPMPERGPFAGLSPSADIVVSQQVLAEPSLDLAEKSWARLSDGTPLATGAPLGRGWLVLIHATIGPEWSNLGRSGLFPDMLRRLLALSQGNGEIATDRPLPPFLSLDGQGRLGAPGPAAAPLSIKDIHLAPSPRRPPGYYGQAAMRVAFNLSPSLDAPERIAWGDRPMRVVYGQEAAEQDWRAPLLLVAFLLLAVDMALAALFRGAFRRAFPLLLVGLAAFAAWDASADNPEKARDAALRARLAYVETGDPRADDVSKAGLDGLTRILSYRTLVEFAPPDRVALADDELTVYPLLYWRITGAQPDLDESGRKKINDYLRQGGMILFDTADGEDGFNPDLARLAQGLEIPPLTAVNGEHVLSRAYYLLQDYPGRFAGGTLWAQNGGDPGRDMVSPVLIGSRGWADAWAMDANGRPLYPATPGGERQREMAYRFGINLVMYALTGSYKADQVHLPAILERMGK